MALTNGTRLGPDEREVRGLAPVLFTFLYLPSSFSQGLVTVTLSYVLAQHGVRVATVASLGA
jgi:hypothetical protein